MWRNNMQYSENCWRFILWFTEGQQTTGLPNLMYWQVVLTFMHFVFLKEVK
jgi:hypothetical protein